MEYSTNTYEYNGHMSIYCWPNSLGPKHRIVRTYLQPFLKYKSSYDVNWKTISSSLQLLVCAQKVARFVTVLN